MDQCFDDEDVVQLMDQCFEHVMVYYVDYN